MAAVSLIHMADAAGDAHHRQRRQERRDADPRREQAIDGADHEAGGDARTGSRRAGPNWSIAIAVVTEARPATAPTERSISTGGEDERHRHRHDRDDRGLADDVEQVVGVRGSPLRSVTAKTRNMATKPM